MDLTGWQMKLAEQLGSNAPTWCTPPDSNERWLFKPIKQRSDNRRNYDDCSELIAFRLATILRIPAARVKLATAPEGLIPGVCGPGIVSRNVAHQDEGWTWVTGDARILRTLNQLVDRTTRQGHTVEVIHDCLQGVRPPLEASDNMQQFSGFDVFCGYLILDALIANQDRHEQNWAVLERIDESEAPRLAASYDHGASLGFNQTDERLEQILATPGEVERFAAKGKAVRLDDLDGRKLSLVDAACRGLAAASPPARAHWQSVIKEFKGADLWAKLEDLKLKVSTPRATFIQQLIEENHRRLKDAAAML